MRTDVKIGLAAGLLLVIAFVTYHAVFKDDAADPNTPEQELASAERPGQGPESGSPGGPGGEEMVLPRFGGISGRSMTATPAGTGSPNVPATAEPPVPPVVGGTPTVSEPPVMPVLSGTPTTSEPPVTAVIDERPTTSEPPVTAVIDERPTTSEPPVTAVIDERPTTTEPPVTPVVTPGEGTITPVVPGIGGTTGGAERTYVVREGDAGFWAIAEKVYGDGRLWALIAKANPGVDSNFLPPGKKLRIPPRPVTPPAAAASEGAGGLLVRADGRKQYVVKKGDAGFWGIAQVVYGNGKHWALIAKANPSFNSTSLKPGDRLAIPPQPPAGTRPAAPVPTIVPGAGERIYTVQKSDSSGFWGIAKKVYGDARHWQVIAKANPSANSSSLKAGQKLLIPTLTEDVRRGTPRPSATRPRPERVARDIEDIGPRPTF
jgi:nucleoid-associated protein YgaU